MQRFLGNRPAAAGPAAQKRGRDDDWKSHVDIKENHGKGSYTVVCNYCNKGGDQKWTTTANRIVAHLCGTGGGVAACKHISDTMRQAMSGEKRPKQASLPNSGKALSKDAADAAVAECFYYNGMAFNIADSEAFKKMCVAIGKVGPDYNPPSRRQLAGKLLDEAHESVKVRIQPLLDAALKLGVTLCSDGWTDINRHPLINILVNTLDGPIFIAAEDTSGHVKDADFLAELMSKHIKELGEVSVILIVTDNAKNCVNAGTELEEVYPGISWVGCAAHCLDLLLKDIFKLDWASTAVSTTKGLCRFVRDTQAPNACMREQTTKEMKMPGDTRFGGNVIMLERLIELEDECEKVTASERWAKFKGKKKSKKLRKVERMEALLKGSNEEGKAMWRDAKVLVALCAPIMGVLRMCDAAAPCATQVYHAMWTLGEGLKTVDLGGKSLTTKRRPAVQAIGAQRWDFMHAPIYAAAYALNPKFQDHDVSGNKEVMVGLREMMGKLLTDEGYVIALQEFGDFKKGRGVWGSELAKRSALAMQPHKYWEAFADAAPTLAKFAERITALGPTASPCERNWSAYEHVVSKKRNRLSVDKAEKLVYVFQNLRTLYATEHANRSELYEQMYFDAFASEDEGGSSDASDEDVATE